MPPQTVYANIVNVKTTLTELVLDFGFVIEQSEQQSASPVQFEPACRVVMAAGVARAFGELLIKAASQQSTTHSARHEGPSQQEGVTSQQQVLASERPEELKRQPEPPDPKTIVEKKA